MVALLASISFIVPILLGNQRNQRVNSIVQKQMACAEEIFKRLDTASAYDRSKLTEHLQIAYRHISLKRERHPYLKGELPKQLEARAARLFYIYGKVLYGGQMDKSAASFKTALTIQLLQDRFSSKKDSLNELINESEDLETFLSNAEKAKLFDSTEKLLLDYTEADVKGLADNPKGYFVARTIYDLANAQQNMDEFRVLTATYTKEVASNHFEKVYGFSRKIFETMAKQTSDKETAANCQWEVACILYDGDRWIYKLQLGAPPKLTKDQMQTMLATLDKLKPYLESENGSERAVGKQAQIYNISMIIRTNFTAANETENQENLKEMYELVCKANQLADTQPNFTPFQRTLYKNNRVSIARKCAKAGLQVAQPAEMRKWMEEVLETIRLQNYNHYYHVTFLLNGARLAQLEGNSAERDRLLAVAKKVTEDFPKNKKENEELLAEFEAEMKAETKQVSCTTTTVRSKKDFF